MTIDSAPTIKAFCVSRIERIKQGQEVQPNEIINLASEGRIQELTAVIQLCDGLEKQSSLMAKVFEPYLCGDKAGQEVGQ